MKTTMDTVARRNNSQRCVRSLASHATMARLPGDVRDPSVALLPATAHTKLGIHSPLHCGDVGRRPSLCGRWWDAKNHSPVTVASEATTTPQLWISASGARAVELLAGHPVPPESTQVLSSRRVPRVGAHFGHPDASMASRPRRCKDTPAPQPLQWRVRLRHSASRLFLVALGWHRCRIRRSCSG